MPGLLGGGAVGESGARREWLRPWMAVALPAALAAGLDVWGFFGRAMPGAPSRWVLEQLEGDATAHWLWGWMVRAAERLPGWETSAWLAGISLFFGVWSVGLLAWLLVRTPHRMVGEMTPARVEREREGRWVAGLAGGVWLAVSAPFWLASTRAGPETFHAWLLLGALRLFWGYRETGRARWLAGSFAAWGVLAAQTATGWFLGPFLLWEAFWESVRWGRHANWRTWAALAAGAVAGLSLFAMEGWWLLQTGRASGGLWNAICTVAEGEFAGLKEISLSPALLVFGAELGVPWATMYWLSHRSPWHYERGERLFRLFLATVLAVLAWTPIFAPCFLVPGGLMAPLAAPQLALAACFGSVAGEMWILGDVRDAARGESRWRRLLRRATGWAAAAMGIASFAAVARNAGLVRIPGDLWTLEATRALAESAAGSRVVFCGPPFDDYLELAARDRRGEGWTTVSVAASRDPERARQLGGRFAGTEAGELFAKGAWEAGVRSWLGKETNGVAQSLAVGMPTLYRGYARLVPEGLAWRLEEPGGATDLAATLEREEALWRNAADQAERRLPQANPHRPHWDMCRHLLGRAINDTAVAAADQGDWGTADRLLELAERIAPENLSVKMNRERAGAELGLPEEEMAARRAYREDDAWEKSGSRWMLGTQWGYLHDPERWVREGEVWALSGAPGEEGALRRDPALADEETDFAKWVDRAFLAVGREEIPERALRMALASNPWSAEPLLELYRTALREGRTDAAEGYLREAEERGVRAESIPFEWLMVDYARLAAAGGGEGFPEGRPIADVLGESPLHDPEAWSDGEGKVRNPADVFEGLVKKDSVDLRPWMAMYLLADGREPESGRIERVFRERRRAEPGLWLALCDLLIERGDWEKARDGLDRVLAANAERAIVWELAMPIAQHYGNERLTAAARDRLSQLRPGHYLAQGEIGREHLARGDLEGAARAFGRGVSHKRDPALLARLAGTLYKLDPTANANAAIELVEESIRRAPERTGARRTLAAIELSRGKTDDALRDIVREMSRGEPVLEDYVLVAEICRARGDVRHVRLALRRIGQLPEEPTFDELRRIVALREWLEEEGDGETGVAPAAGDEGPKEGF